MVARAAVPLLVAGAVVAAAVSMPGGQGGELAVAGRSSANPWIAAAGRFVAVAWGATSDEGVTDIFAAVSRDAGRTFGVPARVSDASAPASLSGEQPPRVSLIPREGRDPSISVAWTSEGPAGTRLVWARSDDSGRSFSRAATVPDGGAPGNRGWQATAAGADGRLVVIWLDHRELAPPDGVAAPGPAGAHQHDAHAAPPAHPMDGAERAQRSKLYFARLDGGAGTARALLGGVCYCCNTTVAIGPAGAIYAAWRHVYPGNIRDIAFAMSRDGGRTFTPPLRVSEDNWVLDGCPENGPSMAIDGSGRIHLVWPTLVPGATPASEPTLALFYAMSQDGVRFTPRQRIPTEDFPGHPQIAVDARGAVMAIWEEQAGGRRRVVMGRGTGDGDGRISFSRAVISDAAPAVYPAIASTADGVIAVWTSGLAGETVLRTARVPY